MAEKETGSSVCFSEQTTVDTLPWAPSKEQPGSSSGLKPSGSSPNLGSAPPAHWADLARAGYFSEEPKGKLEQFTDSITNSITNSVSGLGASFRKKPVPWMHWGSAPLIRKEWFYLKGEQQMPLGPNRWEPFAPEEQNMLTTGSDMLFGRGHGFIADLQDEEQQQVWLGSRLGTATDIVGFDPKLWQPEGMEQPDSELLKTGKGRMKDGHFMAFANERDLVEEYYSTRWWTREEKPSLKVVMMVEETIQSAVREHSPKLEAPEYVLRILNPEGLAVLGFKKPELEKHVMREVKMRFEEIWLGRGHPIYISDGQECGLDESLKSMVKRKKTPQLDVQVMYLNDAQWKLKQEGMGTIIGGHFADLAREGYFYNGAATPQHVQSCCVVC